MREELVTKDKEFDDYKERMTDKEEKIRQLTQTLHSQNIQKEKLERKLKREVDGAKATTDVVQNLDRADELVSILMCISKLNAELDDANREKHKMMLENEIASQEFKRLKESIRKLNSKIVSSGYIIMHIIIVICIIRVYVPLISPLSLTPGSAEQLVLV